jgi:hypothetical protein
MLTTFSRTNAFSPRRSRSRSPRRYLNGENLSFPTPHIGQRKSSGTFSHEVPGGTSMSGHPFAGSYTHKQMSQIYFCTVCHSFSRAPHGAFDCLNVTDYSLAARRPQNRSEADFHRRQAPPSQTVQSATPLRRVSGAYCRHGAGEVLSSSFR